MTSIYDMADEWNDGGTTFTAIRMDVTDTASASDSMLLDLLVGGTRKLGVTKAGTVLLPDDGAIKSGDGGGNSYGIEFNENDGLLFLKGSTPYFRVNAASFIGRSTATIAWASGSPTSGQDTILARDAAGTLAQRNGANAQAFNIYNTYTDASNYERGFMKWNANVLEIGTEAGGTGTVRSLVLGDVSVAGVDLDLGGGTTATMTLGARDGITFQSRSTDRIFLSEAGTGAAHFRPTNDGTVALGSGAITGGGWNEFALRERSTDPGDPLEGQSSLWQSDGTASGDDGDVMMKITAGGVTKTVTLVDFSAA